MDPEGAFLLFASCFSLLPFPLVFARPLSLSVASLAPSSLPRPSLGRSSLVIGQSSQVLQVQVQEQEGPDPLRPVRGGGGGEGVALVNPGASSVLAPHCLHSAAAAAGGEEAGVVAVVGGVIGGGQQRGRDVFQEVREKELAFSLWGKHYPCF